MSYYFSNDETIKTEEKEHHVVIQNIPFIFLTDHGVFSKKGLDFGTRTLLENLPELTGEVLDFGCGYGPIGIFIKKKYSTTVDMVDINKRSLALAHKNACKNEVAVHIFGSDIYQNVTKQYDYIVTNPPIRVGNEILYQILFGAREHLKENGELWFVIHKDQGAKTVFSKVNEVYYAKIVAKNKGFYIICARKR